MFSRLLTFVCTHFLAFSLVAQPINDSCHQAIVLPVPDSCSFQLYSSIGATSETGVAPNPSCGFYRGGDVWFRATMPASGAFRVEIQNVSGLNQLAVYEGACGNMRQITCLQLDGNRTIYRPDLAGRDLYLRSYAYNSSNGGEFNLCVWEPEIPVNNDCGNALPLDVEDSCSFQAFTNVYATADTAGTAPNPSCGFYRGGDVWFTFVMPPSGNLRIEKRNLTTNIQLAVYAGTCGSLRQVECLQLDNDRTYIDPSVAGDTLLLRAFTYNSEEGGTFELCLWEPDIPINNLCANAIYLPVNDSCTYQTFTNAYADADSSGTAPSPGCGFYRGGDVWFTFVMPQSGNLRIEKRNLTTNIQLAVYEGRCGQMQPIACMQLDDGRTIVAPDLAGDTLYIRAFTYNSDEGGEFDICLFEPIIPLNDLCANATNLINRDTCRPIVFSGVYATTDSAGTAPNPNCGFYRGGDVWFNVVMPPTGTLEIERQNLQGVLAQMALYSGQCGQLNLLHCGLSQNRFTYTDSLLIGEELLLRVYNYNSDENGVFSLCAIDTTCEVRERLDTITICSGESYSIAGQTYDSTGTYQYHLRAKGGCDSIITTHLTVLPPLETQQTIRFCAGDSIRVGGNLYTQTGQYVDTLLGRFGCDSVVTTDVQVDTLTVTISSNDTSLFVDTGFASYEWGHCGSIFIPISNKDQPIFIPQQSGQYAVVVTDSSGCSDTSDCIDFVMVGMDSPSKINFSLYPNPAVDAFTFLNPDGAQVTIQLYDPIGQIILQRAINTAQTNLIVSDWPSGWYHLIVRERKTGKVLDSKILMIQH